MEGPDVAVVGGAVAGLAAADRLAEFAEVTLFERQSYDDKRVNCGEAINDATLVPLAKTRENGFLNDLDGFDLYVYDDDTHGPDEDPLTISPLDCPPGWITDRDVVERRWAQRLRRRGVDVRTGPDVAPTAGELAELTRTYDYVVDATGQPSLTSKAFDRGDRYTGDMVALNADVEGDFSAYRSRPRILFEGFVGYSWVFPKSDRRANVGIGWASDDRPDDYMAALEAACRRNDLPVPDRADTNVYTIPRGPSLDPQQAALPDRGLYLVGDAAGIANRYQGEGICQAIRSSYLLADCLREDRGVDYPGELYRLMAPEYRLATLMRGAWEEHQDSALLAAVADCLAGLTIDEVTHQPSTVIRRVLRRPGVAARLLSAPGMWRRLGSAYTDRWEYASA
jgi:digeranylgeranylglycerophospholipid reductase